MPKRQGKAVNPFKNSRESRSTNRLSLQFVADGMTVLGKPKAGEWQLFFKDICRLTRMTWQDLTDKDHRHGGMETIPSHAIRKPIPSKHKDIPRFTVIRMAGDAARLVGIRVGREFHIIWMDTGNLTLYKH